MIDPSSSPPPQSEPTSAEPTYSEIAARDRPSRERLLLALELGGVGSFDWNLVTGEGAASPGCYEIFGYDANTTPTYSNVLRVVLPEDMDAFRQTIDHSLSTRADLNGEFRIVRPSDGLIRWIRVDGGIDPDEQGRAGRMVGIVRDVTERRMAQDREQILMKEVDHRAKNLLTVVQSLVQLTRAEDMHEFRAAVSGRIQALGRAHSLLAASRWEGADITALVDEEIAPFTGLLQRIRADGPPVKLRAPAAQSMALVLHELLTNAVKYGALSNQQGSVELRWSLHRPNDDRLHLEWCEHGGPEVHPPSRRGFGTTVISASVERQLGGTLQYDWRPEGLCLALWLPAKELVETGSAAASRAPQALQEGGLGTAAPLSVLIVEDEPLIALQIAQWLRQEGCEIVGPAASVGEALELMTTIDFNAALLDVDLNGARSFPIADLLRETETPFGFLSGFGASELPLRFRSSPLLSKPLCPRELRSFIVEASTGKQHEGRVTGADAQGQLFSNPHIVS